MDWPRRRTGRGKFADADQSWTGGGRGQVAGQSAAAPWPRSGHQIVTKLRGNACPLLFAASPVSRCREMRSISTLPVAAARAT